MPTSPRQPPRLSTNQTQVPLTAPLTHLLTHCQCSQAAADPLPRGQQQQHKQYRRGRQHRRRQQQHSRQQRRRQQHRQQRRRHQQHPRQQRRGRQHRHPLAPTRPRHSCCHSSHRATCTALRTHTGGLAMWVRVLTQQHFKA